MDVGVDAVVVALHFHLAADGDVDLDAALRPLIYLEFTNQHSLEHPRSVQALLLRIIGGRVDAQGSVCKATGQS